MRKKFKKNINSLDHIFDFITKFVTNHKLSEATTFAINMAVEEIFINMVKYNAGSLNDILLSLSRDANKLIVSLTDYDVEPFDIKEVKKYNRTQTLKDRQPGGMGIYLVKKLVDKIDYEYKERNSKVTLTKYLENDNV